MFDATQAGQAVRPAGTDAPQRGERDIFVMPCGAFEGRRIVVLALLMLCICVCVPCPTVHPNHKNIGDAFVKCAEHDHSEL